MPQGTTLEAQQRTVWRALLGSLALYAALPWFLRPEPRVESVGAMLLGLTAISLVTAIATFAVRELLLNRPIRSGELRVDTDAGRNRLMQLYVVLWALCESVGVYGLVLYMLSGEARYLYLFLMASAGLFFAHRPGRWPASDTTRVG
jgi:hypothetical protein